MSKKNLVFCPKCQKTYCSDGKTHDLVLQRIVVEGRGGRDLGYRAYVAEWRCCECGFEFREDLSYTPCILAIDKFEGVFLKQYKKN